MKALVTGASGFIGSYLVKELRVNGHQVTAFCHPGSVTAHLRDPGVTIAAGDVTDPASLLSACKGQDWVFHAAAIVSGYGSWRRFKEVGVEGTKNVIDAAATSAVKRFVHISSIVVYGTRSHGVPLTETMPFDENAERWNHYVRQKVLSEKLLWKAHREGRIQATAVRPSMALGPRDDNVVRRAVSIVKSPLGAIIGAGENRVPCVVVEELAVAIVRAGSSETAIGKAYNLSGSYPITQMEFMRLHAVAAGLKPLTRRLPISVLMAFCTLMEGAYRLVRCKNEPFCTRLALALGGHDYEIDCSRATADLGWKGSASYEDAIRRGVKWYLEHQRRR
ncbi:MAG: NAD-dependent epimerase/dehydratase family protein [Deltaproteobacteria bacterium]|nr:MAG: NAD-dependent epimerase/dehydratase family protein [Deltaproteobacteria bacterium]